MGFSVVPRGFFGGFATGVTVNEALGVVVDVELNREARKGFDELLTGDDIKENELLLGNVSGSSRAGPVVFPPELFMADCCTTGVFTTLVSCCIIDAELVRLETKLPVLLENECGGMTIFIFLGIPPSVNE